LKTALFYKLIGTRLLGMWLPEGFTMDKMFLDVPFEIKALQDEEGIFEGYGSIFGNLDADGDVIEPGAFTKSLQMHQSSQTQPALLWMHNPYQPVGRYLDIREDARGLYVKGQLILESTQGRDAYALLKGGAINGLSIGYIPKNWELDKVQKTRRLKEVALWEVSLVTFPANTLARVMAVKSKIISGEIPTLQELEQLLCQECGMNEKESQLLLKSGYEAYTAFVLNQTEDLTQVQVEALITLLER
jgi:HK97 family phage prohead protease